MFLKSLHFSSVSTNSPCCQIINEKLTWQLVDPIFFKGYMFLVLIFCVTLKNSPCISINVFKIPTFFHRKQNSSLSSIFTDRTNGKCHIDATKDILVISNKVHGPNSPLPKTLLTKIPTLTPIWSVIVTCSLNGSLTA